MMIYLDTSALVKEYHDEEGSRYLHEIYRREKEGKEKLFISQWTISETINVLDKHKMGRELTDEEFEIVIGDFFRDFGLLVNAAKKKGSQAINVEEESTP